MKGFFFCLSVALFSVGLLNSCQREIDWDLPNNITTDSTVLWKYIEIDTTLSAGLDTLEKYLYEYDNLDRISRIINYSRSDTSSSPAYSDTLISVLLYQGTDSLPYKTITNFGYGDGSTSTITCFINFQAGKLMSDSSIGNSVSPLTGVFNYMRAHYYTYSGTTTTIVERLTVGIPPSSLCETGITVTRTMSGNNILSETGLMTGCTTGGWDKQQTYDNKKNPFCFFTAQLPSLIVNAQYLWIAPTSNIRTEQSASMFANNSYTYEYKTNGLPSVVRVLDLQSGAYNYKGLYYYKN